MTLITTSDAINNALDICLEKDSSVYMMGLGVPDPKGIFGTTLGLDKKYPDRVMDMPCAENGMTGVAIGSALVGMRPILVHQRLDFALLSMDQIVNQAAKWHFMFGGQCSIPMVIRMIVGRGWGQGPQHSQSLQSLFAHIPGLKIVMPSLPQTAKGLLIASIEDDNPVLFIEHRWTHNLKDDVPDGYYTIPIGKSAILNEGTDITIVSMSYMTVEVLKTLAILKQHGISVDLIDLQSIVPLDQDTILKSVKKTGRLLVVDTSWKMCSVASEILATVFESGVSLKSPPKRLHLPNYPVPTSHFLSNGYYPNTKDIIETIAMMTNRALSFENKMHSAYHDIADPQFKGPF